MKRTLWHPRYWPLWLGFGLLCVVAQLPYPLLCRLGRFLVRRFQYDVMYRPSENPVIKHVVSSARKRGCGELIPRRAAKRALRRLRTGHMVWYAPDQNTQRKKWVS